MILRCRLPQRRGAIAVELEHTGHHFRMQIRCFRDGALASVIGAIVDLLCAEDAA